MAENTKEVKESKKRERDSLSTFYMLETMLGVEDLVQKRDTISPKVRKGQIIAKIIFN